MLIKVVFVVCMQLCITIWQSSANTIYMENKKNKDLIDFMDPRGAPQFMIAVSENKLPDETKKLCLWVNQFYCFETTEKPVHHFCIVKLNDLRCYKSLKDWLKSCYTRGHNVLELFNILAKFPKSIKIMLHSWS